MDLQLNGKTALVTGRDQARLDAAVDTIEASGGKAVSGVLADAATAEGAARLAQAAPAVDILVNTIA